MLVIGIAGGSGSGKTTLAERLRKAFPGSSLLVHDNYYRHHPDMTPEQRASLNYDHPDALETELLVTHLKQLKAGQPVDSPVYDFATHLRSTECRRVAPCRMLIVEGILLFHSPELRDLLDWRIFVDEDADIRLLRRILRDSVERGRDIGEIARQYLDSVRPMHLQFVEPTKAFAHRIVRDFMEPATWQSICDDVQGLLKNENPLKID